MGITEMNENDYRKKRESTEEDNQQREEEPKKIVKLPWIPGISQKLRKLVTEQSSKVQQI